MTDRVLGWNEIVMSCRALVAVLLAVLMVAGGGEAIALPQRTWPVVPAAAGGDAAGALAVLPVKGRAPKTGYSRAEFGQRWKDIDHYGATWCGQLHANKIGTAP